MSFDDLAEGVLKATNRTLGRLVTYSPSGSDDVEIYGVFDNIHIEVSGVSSLRPSLRIQLSDLNEVPTSQDTVTVSEVSYSVIDCQEDGFGGALLVLHKE